ncbi:hypothetical protein [Streptomyces sp. H39-S7]|uniref:hypothetical protein n=1 Tax=Streptomyces sp. H39-S7 TaxID=3004357 RepID=UPI0022B01D56|nr:hypothetical protein [Streptomyces sp. H39-S7]MCZ4126175.1 hypothetical protein [Streptomyces sp. H39-S7]
MSNTLTTAQGALGTSGAVVLAAVHQGLTVWAAALLAGEVLILLTAVLFARSDTPARRLSALIHAWHAPAPAPAPVQQSGDESAGP